ncbi:MAG: hypothetical protein ABMA13_11270 [Chthoniobacteraceae bacterium]
MHAVTSGVCAQTTPGNFAEVPFERLSERTIAPLGARALAIRKADWKHAESAHFVYHFFQSFVAAPVSVEAEFFYTVVAKELGRDTSQWERKCHIYIFEKPADWTQFKVAGQLDPWTGGLCAGGELFIVRDPQVKWKGDTLGHEVTHLVLHRFFGPGIPLWLNEGFAEYAAARGYAAFWRARGFQARPRSQAVDPARWIPLAEIIGAAGYPADVTKVATFYHQSERLVRFLSSVDKAGFQRLLEALAQGNRFDTALGKSFHGKFADLAALERAAKEYATREHGTAIQDR